MLDRPFERAADRPAPLSDGPDARSRAPSRAPSRASSPLLELRDTVVEAPGRGARTRLLDGVNLALDADAATVVMGANGAGKSVLLRVMHGLIAPTQGGVYWRGRALGRDARRAQAMVFQRAVLLRRSVAANIDFALTLRGRRGAERRERRDALLAHVGLSDQARQPARLLSGGEQQRLALARALATEPELLLLDEPTANLDPASTERLERLVGDAKARGVKIVFVTHDVGQAKRLADEILFLHCGRVVERAPADRFFRRPEAAAARGYLEGRLVF